MTWALFSSGVGLLPAFILPQVAMTSLIFMMQPVCNTRPRPHIRSKKGEMLECKELILELPSGMQWPHINHDIQYYERVGSSQNNIGHLDT